MPGHSWLHDPSTISVFRDTMGSGDLTPLHAALEALETPGFTGEEVALAKAALLMLCVRCYPTRMASAVDLLLAKGADPGLPVESDERPLAGMRPNLFCADLTPLGQAIDNGDQALVKLFFDVANGGNAQSVGCTTVPHAGVLRVEGCGGPRAANVLAFACACGQSEIMRAMVARLDGNNAAVRRAMGEAIDSLLVHGLMHQGPDSVVGDIVTLIAHGADLSLYATQELACREVRLDNGYNQGDDLRWKYAPFAALAIIAALPQIGVAQEDVVTTLSRLQEDCEIDLSTVALPHFPGATLLDIADLVGCRAIVGELLHSGLRRSANGRAVRPHIVLSELLGEACAAPDGPQDGQAHVGFVSPHLVPVGVEHGMDRHEAAVDGGGTTAAQLYHLLRSAQLAGRRASNVHRPRS